MNLEDIFDQLSYGELSQVFVGSSDSGKIANSDRARIAATISLALTELYKRFPLKEKRVKILYSTERQTYVLHTDYVMSGTGLVKYIDDSVDPFINDLIQIERVYDDEGNELSLNIIDDPAAIRTTSYNTLAVPNDLDTEYLEVVYRANHPEWDDTLAIVEPSSVSIELPITHLEALLLYVASRIITPIGMTSEFHDGNNYTAKFEAACARLNQLNMRIDTSAVNTRFEMFGWV